MASVIQRPDSISLLRNLLAFRINTSDAVTFALKKGDNLILEETYYPDGTDIVTIDVQEVVAQYLSIRLPESNIFQQTSGQADFEAYVDGEFCCNFTVIMGGVRKLADSAANWLKANWLTWQPQVKQVRWNQPEYLTYYHQVPSRVVVRFYPKAGSPEKKVVYSAKAGELISYNMEMAHLFSLSTYEASQLNGYVDVWVETILGMQLTYVQRYVFIPVTRREHYYFCVNSLGGVDTFCFTGAHVLAPSIEHESAEQASRKISITSKQERAWQQGTGNMGKYEAKWLWDFFASMKQWAIIDSNIEEIVLDSSSIKASSVENLNASEFSYTLAEEGQLLRISRSLEELPVIEVQSPTGELFFLAPRVTDYPDANLENDLLFLVQSPYVQEWKKVSLATLKHWIESIFTPYEHLPLRLEISTDGDEFLAWGESLKISCKVWKGIYEDVTNEVTEWSIVRNSGVPIEDAAWGLKPKVQTFDGTIEICYNARENDLGETTTSVSTIFTIVAYINRQTATAEIVI